MYFKTIRLVIFLLGFVFFSCCLSFSGGGSDLPSVHDGAGLSKRANRQLIAAQVESNIGKRSIDQALRCDHELHYVDGEYLGQLPQMSRRLMSGQSDTLGKDENRLAAQVHLTTKLPTLTLEDIDHHLTDVTCAGSSMTLRFATTSARDAAMKDFGRERNFYIVTAHDTCNNGGERNVYLVSSLSNTDERDLDLVLSISRVPWKESVQTIRVDFGKSNTIYRFPHQGAIGKRQTSSSSEAAVLNATGTGTASATVPVSFPAPPTATPTATSVSQDIAFSYIDTPLLPPSFPGVDSITLSAPGVPNGVSFQCKNCTVTGTIDIMQGSVSGNANTAGPDDDEDEGFSWDGGSFTFEANDFSAHIELGVTVEPTLSLFTYNAPMPSIGLPGFQIPGIGIVGPIFKPGIVVGAEIGTKLDFTYGFDLTVPDNSSITLDLVDSEDSTITGFPDLKISALPFTCGVDNVALTVSAAFRPELLLGVKVLTATIGAGIFFNLPTIAATISQVAHVNSKCEAIPDNATSSTVNGVLEDVFGSLTHIEPSVEFDFGVLAEAQVDKFGAEDVYTIFNTIFPLPTACLEFDKGKLALGAVTPSSNGKAIAAASAIHLILSPATGKIQIPILLRGEVPPSSDNADDNIGTRNYSKAPAAVILGAGYEDAHVVEMREMCKSDSRIPWLRPDLSKPAPPLGPEYGEAIVQRVKSRLGELSAGGQMDAITACAITTILWPKTIVYAEAPPEDTQQQQLSRKPIYDDLAPLHSKPQHQPQSPNPSSSPTPTTRLAHQIQHLRLSIHAYSSTAESRFNTLMSTLLTQERSFTSTIASLAPPLESHERIMPGALYVLVAAMSGSIMMRRRNILLRATVPFALGVGAAWVVLPVTMRNVGDLVWRYEERVPVLAENHLRVRGAAVQGWKEIKSRGEMFRGWSDERVREGREAVEGWVRKGK
ncbi:MAG: hypothetical protein Q9186_000552 [Xanthomendoza sp. 1 TL-2023]